MGRRRHNLKSRNRVLMAVFGPPLLLFSVIVAGLYIYNSYTDPAKVMDRAITDCVQDRTRVSADSLDQAASDCVREMKPDENE